MPALLEREIAAETSLRFACGNCGAILSVPIALAGVRGPCPHCQHLIEAPRPPVRRPLRPPLSRQADSGTALPETQPKPLPATPSRATRDISPALSSAASVPHRVESDTTPYQEEDDASSEESERALSVEEKPPRAWKLIAAGAVLGALGALGLGSVWGLKRDLSPASAPGYAASATASPEDDAGAVAALDEFKREAAREAKALLAAQEVVWRFFSAESAEEAQALLDAPPAELPASAQRRATLEKVTLRAKRRLADEAGYAAQWSVVTAEFGELSVETTNSSGQARLRWATLAPQLQE